MSTRHNSPGIVRCDCVLCRPGESIMTPSQMKNIIGGPIGSGNFQFVMTRYGAVPNRLFGTEINHEGDAI